MAGNEIKFEWSVFFPEVRALTHIFLLLHVCLWASLEKP